ncbi:uncharacterized protein LOC118409908 isoform X2 [Branchiostoma floridae]|uniref:Uncharacterized protein LOC118409908 isoform X2 n=1 Tax=Branchiostoma floridae TaxID=7739 RepID=A0A9J7KNE2_BRAFL|nr:uncharacterized protein LOC118409908 isoform X2 [Branchiostoma floridae]
MAKLSMIALPFLIIAVAAHTPVHRQQEPSTTMSDLKHDIIPNWTMAQLRYDGCRIYAEFEPKDLSGQMCDKGELKDVQLTDIDDTITATDQPEQSEAPKPAAIPNIVSLGCWLDKNPGRAIPTLEGTDARLDGGYHDRKNAIEKCYQVAKERGFSVFALQNGGHCRSSASAGLTYKTYGPSTSCGTDGEGGPWGNQVYQITDALPETDTNIAQGKPAFQTTVAWGMGASLAVDGNTNTEYYANSCQHNGMEDNPMWWVDLGKSFTINRVVIFNRQDCCFERINPFNIHIGDSDQVSTNPKCGGDHQINVNQPSISILCQGMTGRYVGIRLPGHSRILTLCEVQVFSEQPLSTKTSSEKLYELLKLEKQKTRVQDETISTLWDKINDLTSADSNSFPKPGLPLQPCPDSYSEYNNKCYKLSTEQMTFGEAKAVCQRDGGILAIINAQDTNHLVVKKIRADGKPYWIGLTDVRSEGTFVRSDETESPAAYTNWYPHQPDNGGGEDCVEMSVGHDWNDAPCSSRLNFICEKEKISRWICPPLYLVGFKDRCFRLSTKKANFRRAKTICEQDGGRLAVLQDEETDLFIRKKIRRLPYERTLSYWIGLSDAQEEGTFVWTDGTELTASDYTHWRPGNPDNAVVGDGEDCVEIRQELDYMWNDVDCRKKRHFVCEKDVALASVSDQTMLMTEAPPLETESSNNPGHEQHTTPGLDEDGCTWRIQELHEKDREVQEQAQTITELTAQLEQKDEEIHDVTTRLHQKEEEIHDVTTRLHQKEEEMQDVTIRLHQKEEEIQDVNIRLQWKDQEIQDVTTQLQWKDQEIQDVTTQLQWKDEEIQDLKIRLQQKEKEIQDLTNHLQQRQEENEQFSTEVGTPVTPAGSESRGYTSLGCWEDAYDRAIPTLEKTDARLDGDFFTRNNPIEKCYQVALSRGFPVFALQAGGWCAGSADAHTTHSKYGPSIACAADGEGGPWANEVYQITGMLPEECLVEPSLRQECGWGGITQHQCRQRGCCFDSSVPTMKWCFHKKAPKKWRDDHRCGQGYPAEDGNPAECNPAGGVPCCSQHNWCGNTADHCDCPACVDYRNTDVPVSPSGGLPDHTQHTAAELIHQNDDQLLHTTDRMQDFTTQLQQKEEEIRHFTTPLVQPPPTVQTTPSEEYCREGNGASYRGTVSATKTGKTCQRWDSQTPHGHGRTPANYPSSGLEENYCRNPDGELAVWCYTMDPNTRWEFCDVPVCGPYGQVKFTKSGVFVVPDGVTSVDVICIGGGGGGRDDHAEILGASPYGGNGGNSSFGPYLSAEGGKGAKAGNIGVWLTQDPSWVVYSTGKPWVMDGAVQDAAKVLDEDTGTYWNPSDTGNSHNNWYIVLDLTAPQTLTRIAVNNYGDITHDIAVFRLQKSSIASPYIWEDVVSVTDVRGGTVQRQEFGGFRGTARYWRFLITRTHEGWQPYLTELNLYAISLGGEGGEGTVAFGGQGGVGGGCSAGAGAAGQTSGGGGGLVPGSSTHPFCGAGGSSGGSSCGTGLADIPPGKSGPGGEDPDGRRGGQYGGGGGSRAGARAGGGGGYSRAEVHVIPGERIAVTVGEAGTPHYAKPGDGVVVVAWGREIDPTGDMATCPGCVDADCPCQESAAVTTQAPATTGVSVPTVDRTRCLGSSGFCPGADVTGATCVDGFCECSGSNYQRDTCLPVVGSCVVTRGSPVARAEAFQAADPKETLSCVADDNSKYEIHVLAVYKSSAPTRIFLEEPTGSADMNVYVTAGQLDRPLVLVLSSYGAVNWVLHLPEDVEVHKVLLMAFYVEKSDVAVRSGSVNDVQRLSGHTGGAPPCAYGEDNGGCKTVELLEYISGEFGPVSSLTGTFMADAWNLTIGNDPISTPTETSISIPTETSISTSTETSISTSTETSISAPETSIVCERTTLRLSCPAGETLEIDDANYGRTATANSCHCGFKCPHNCQSADSLSIVRSACQGLQECTVEANNSVFGDPCPFIGKFLEATYHCVPEATVERGDPEVPPASFPEEP